MTTLSFLKSFDPEPSVLEEPQQTLLYTQEQMDAQYQTGFEAGVTHGQQEVLTGIEVQLCDHLQGIRLSLEDLYNDQHQRLQKIYQDAQDVAAGIAQKHAQTEAEKNAVERCYQFVKTALSCLLERVPVCVTVHDQWVTPLQEKFKDDTICVMGDSNMALTDSRVSWPYGGACASFEGLQEKIEEARQQWLKTDPVHNPYALREMKSPVPTQDEEA